MRPTAPSVLKLLEGGPLTVQQIAAHFPAAAPALTSRVLCDVRQCDIRRVYISEWVVGKGHPKARYALGNKPDAPKPTTLHGSVRGIPRVPNSVWQLGAFL